MPTRSVRLTEHLNSFVEGHITSGRFSSASEVVREGLRLLEQREAEDRAKLDWLRTTTQVAFEALDHGEGISLSSPGDLDTLMNEVLNERRASHNASRG